MQFAPEAQILIMNGVILAVAYLGIYPGMADKTLSRVAAADLVLSVIAMTAAGALFWGTGTQFNMLFFHGNWAIFTLITMCMIEVPLFLHFARKHGIDLFDDPD